MAVEDRPQRQISRSVFFLSLSLMAVVAFIAGTRQQTIIEAVGPALGFKVAKGDIDLSSVEKLYRELNTNFDGKLDKNKLIDGAKAGLVSGAGDKFTTYFTAAEAKSFDDSLNGNVGAGIGAQIGMRGDQPTIVRVLPGNPAQRAGVKDGDTIMAVNDKSTDGVDSDTVATSIRGKVGTTVRVKVLRDGKELSFSIVRQKINDPSVLGEVKDGVGIMTISRFDSQTGNLARQTAESFANQHVKGVIVDLRGNGGGVVDAAQAVASIWLDDKVVVTERTDGKVVETVKSDSNPVLAGVPTVLLVNEDTASASEIVAGALRDGKAATLVGKKTYGKGTMQQLIDLGGGSQLKVTIAHWYTPSGISINHNGLIPNKLVDITADDVNNGKDPQMDAARTALGL